MSSRRSVRLAAQKAEDSVIAIVKQEEETREELRFLLRSKDIQRLPSLIVTLAVSSDAGRTVLRDLAREFPEVAAEGVPFVTLKVFSEKAKVGLREILRWAAVKERERRKWEQKKEKEDGDQGEEDVQFLGVVGVAAERAGAFARGEARERSDLLGQTALAVTGGQGWMHGNRESNAVTLQSRSNDDGLGVPSSLVHPPFSVRIFPPVQTVIQVPTPPEIEKSAERRREFDAQAATDTCVPITAPLAEEVPRASQQSFQPASPQRVILQPPTQRLLDFVSELARQRQQIAEENGMLHSPVLPLPQPSSTAKPRVYKERKARIEKTQRDNKGARVPHPNQYTKRRIPDPDPGVLPVPRPQPATLPIPRREPLPKPALHDPPAPPVTPLPIPRSNEGRLLLADHMYLPPRDLPENVSYRVGPLQTQRLMKYQEYPYGWNGPVTNPYNNDYSDPRWWSAEDSKEDQEAIWRALQPTVHQYRVITGIEFPLESARNLCDGYMLAHSWICRKFEQWCFANLPAGHEMLTGGKVSGKLFKLERWYGLIADYEFAPNWQYRRADKHRRVIQNPDCFACNECIRFNVFCHGHREDDRARCVPCVKNKRNCSKEVS